MNELISVIVPVYNGELYLEECVKSILAQTYRNFELIIVNDGSTDGTSEIIKKYAGMDSRIKFLNKENAGVSAARNSGITLSTGGGYIAFVDSDDLIEKEYLEKLSARAACGYDVVYCRYNRFNDDKKYLIEETLKECNSGNKFELLYKNLFNIDKKNASTSIMGSSCRSLIKKSLIKVNKITFNENLRFCEDLVFMQKVIIAAKKIGVLDEPLYNYRINENSCISSYKRNFHKNQEILISEITENLKYFRDNNVIDDNIFRKYIDLYTFLCICDLLGNEIHCPDRTERKSNLKKLRKSRYYKNFTLRNLLRIKKYNGIKMILLFFMEKFRVLSLIR